MVQNADGLVVAECGGLVRPAPSACLRGRWRSPPIRSCTAPASPPFAQEIFPSNFLDLSVAYPSAARTDLDLRGPGDVLGTDQSGRGLLIQDIMADKVGPEVLQAAREVCLYLFVVRCYPSAGSRSWLCDTPR